MKVISTLQTVVITCVLSGCRGVGTQKFIAFAPEQTAKLESASRNVVDVRCKVLRVQADYSFSENLHMLAPIPKRVKFDADFEIEHVVKGDAHGPIYVPWLRSPTPEQCRTLKIPTANSWDTGFTNRMPLRIGFSRETDKGLEDLRILVRDQKGRGN